MIRGCINCGTSALIDAVDNFGQPYKGCANCIVLPAVTCFGCRAVAGGAIDECPRHPRTTHAKDRA